jgi:SAM-dependent methyltransferase
MALQSSPGDEKMSVKKGATKDRKARTAAARGQRLHPSPWSRTFCVLSALRDALEQAIANCVAGHRCQTLVDFGCGNMPYRPLFAPHVSQYVGCDLEGNELADVIMPVPDRLPLADQSVDIVLSTQVLEHVEDPIQYLREAYRVSRSGGLLILSTHGVWKYHPDPFDYWRWTSAGLRRIVEETGFIVVSFRGVLGAQAAALQLWQESVTPRIPKKLQPLFHRYMQWRIQRADERCSDVERDRDASVYVLVAKRDSNLEGP